MLEIVALEGLLTVKLYIARRICVCRL